MRNRRATPNLLDPLSEIMGETVPNSNKALKQEIIQGVKQPLSNEIKPADNKGIKRASAIDEAKEQDGVFEEEPKEKATFNLSIKLLRELEDKWMEMRRLSGSKRISKTLIVEKALEMALAEFEIKKDRSMVYCKLASNK